ncbi:MAG: hypothetical protein AB1634_02715 [Thermodesulfobacteriota bacterium]
MVDYPEIPVPPPVGQTPLVLPGQVRLRIFRRPRGQGQPAGPRPERRGRSGADLAAEDLRETVQALNAAMEDRGVPLHLTLLATASGLVLEIYDCSGQELCAVIKEERVALAELPELLRRLETRAGLLVDTTS